MAESKSARPLVGDVVAGRYRIDSIAGEGGMGIVYEAEHVILRQRVALKILLPGALSSAEALERFSQEAAAIARISCEHVVRVMDAGTLPSGAPYLVMEYLEGKNLEQLLQIRGPLPYSDAVDFALQTLEALAHAHAAHVIHRDLKSANLFFAKLADGRQIIKLLDFGVAMTIDGHDDNRIVGSPAYMSPEQLCREAVDARTDLWSLGVVLYEMLAGVVPFEGTFAQTVHGVLNTTPVPLNEKNAAIPPALAAVVQRCLTRDVERRWSSTLALARALAPFASSATTGVVPRIERAVANVSPVGERRRFETLETALQALDEHVQKHKRSEVSTVPPAAMGFGETMPAPASGALRIAMLDESPATLRAQSDLLTQAGFEVRTSTKPEELDRILEAWKPHLVLVEAETRLCRKIKDRFKATLPVVVVSNLPAARLEEVAKEDGADASFRKANDGQTLVEFVRNICAMTYSPEDLPDFSA
ncbi:MAG: protein kinase [Labilithrix sp.]